MSTESTAPRAAIYARLSMDSDGTGAAVERQQADCEALAEAEGLTVVEVLVDNDVSAYSGKHRPGFERLLDLAARGEVDTVLVWSLDRLYRRVPDLGRVVEACKPFGVAVQTVKSGRLNLSTADGRLVAGLLAEVAEHESAKKAERMAARWAQRATVEGRTTTAWLPFGWQWVDPCPAGEDCNHPTRCEVPGVLPRHRTRKGLRPDPVDAAALRWAAGFIADGGTLSAAAARLRAQGLTGGKGLPLSVDTLRNALLSPRSAGLATLRGEVVGEAGEGALLDRELWERVRAVLDDPKRRTTVGAPGRNLLTGVLHCPAGHPMQASNRHNRNGTTDRVYKCGRCNLKRRTDLLEPPVVELVAAMLTRWKDQLLSVASPTAGPAQVKAAAEVAALRTRLGTLAALASSGDLDPDDFAAAARGVRDRLADAEGRAARVTGRPATAKLMKDPRGPAAAWRDAVANDTDTARAVLRELVDAVTLKPAAVPRKPAATDLDVLLAEWLRELMAQEEVA
jgi:site-specific DNA recombinase